MVGIWGMLCSGRCSSGWCRSRLFSVSEAIFFGVRVGRPLSGGVAARVSEGQGERGPGSGLGTLRGVLL